MSDFDGTPFAAGTMVGLRQFNVDESGELRGSMGQVWCEGENTAVCLLPAWIVVDHHEPAAKDCACGFWAYTDPDAVGTHDRCQDVIAIVEGYGHVTYGPLGFRSSKARIVALVGPQPGADAASRSRWFAANLSTMSPWHRMASLYLLDRKWEVITNMVSVVLGAVLLMSLTAYFVAATDKVIALIMCLMLFATSAISLVQMRHHAAANDYINGYTRQRGPLLLAQQGTDAIARRYPGVPFYATLDEAMAAHPITAMTHRGDDEGD